MRVVIPVAGVGVRLRPLTYSRPKSLLYVGGKPILAHLLDPIVKLNPDEVIFVIGFLGRQVREYVESNYSFKATFVEQDELLGLGYALNLAIRDIPDGDLLVLLGDTVVRCDLRQFVAAGDNVLGVLPVDDPTRFGIVNVTDGRVSGMVEKPENPESNLAIIGLYYFKDVNDLKPALADHVTSGRKTRGEIQFTDALQMTVERGLQYVPYEVRDWFDCGKKETMLSTNRHLLATLGNTPRIEGAVIEAPVFIDPTARVINSTIGPAVSISEGTVIRNSSITNSIIGTNCTIENAGLADSLVGNDVTLKGNGRESVMVVNISDSTEIEPLRE